MLTTNNIIKNTRLNKRQHVANTTAALVLLVLSLPTQAVEVSVTGHQGTEYETQGFSVSISDNFSRRSPFYWNLGFSRYDELFIEWNNRELKLPINSAEFSFSYRPQFNSRNPKIRRFSMEYEIGAATSLTENKFIWADLGKEEYEKFFSETGDINGFIAISANYKISSNISANLGVKHFPKMSEFGSISTVFLGFKFNLDFSPTYYGR